MIRRHIENLENRKWRAIPLDEDFTRGLLEALKERSLYAHANKQVQ